MDTLYIALIVASVVFIIGVFGLIKKINLPYNAAVTFIYIFYLLGVLLFFCIALSLFGIYFRGYWTTKVIVWLFILIASVICCFVHTSVATKRLKIFTRFLFYFPLASVLMWFLIPFLGAVFALIIWGRVLGDTNDVYYSDSEIRIQKNSEGPLAPPGLKAFKLCGMLEFDQGILNSYGYPDSVKVSKTADSITIYFFKNTYGITTNPVISKLKR